MIFGGQIVKEVPLSTDKIPKFFAPGALLFLNCENVFIDVQHKTFGHARAVGFEKDGGYCRPREEQLKAIAIPCSEIALHSQNYPQNEMDRFKSIASDNKLFIMLVRRVTVLGVCCHV